VQRCFEIPVLAAPDLAVLACGLVLFLHRNSLFFREPCSRQYRHSIRAPRFRASAYACAAVFVGFLIFLAVRHWSGARNWLYRRTHNAAVARFIDDTSALANRFSYIP
jgi:hypothetical protein